MPAISGGLNRCSMIAGSPGASAAGLVSPRLKSATWNTRLILLRTGGGSSPLKSSSGCAQVIFTNGMVYMVGCGDGVACQLAWADVPLTMLKSIVITHHQSDHNADVLVHEAFFTPGVDRHECLMPPRSSRAFCPVTPPRRTPAAGRETRG